jgi:protein-disulfide isomerase
MCRSVGRLAMLVALVASLVGAGCGTGEAEGAAGTEKGLPSTAAKGDPCARFGFRICMELGERSDGCRALQGTLAYMPPSACEASLADIDHALGRIETLRKDCLTVGEQLCRDTGEDSETCKAAKEDLPRVPPGHCKALLENYSQVLQAQIEREAAMGPLDVAGRSALMQGTPPSFGQPSSTVEVVEFSDFQCPYCAQAAQTVQSIKAKYADKVRFVFRHFPLPFHEHARLASQAAAAAHRQGQFWAYHDLLFAHQDALEREALESYAQKLGLDMKLFRADLDRVEVVAEVEADLQLGDRVHVNGTPTLFINGERVENPLDFDAVSEQLDAVLEAGAK